MSQRTQQMAGAVEHALIAALARPPNAECAASPGLPGATPAIGAAMSEATAPAAPAAKATVFVPPSELPEWPAVVMHASLTASGISVVLRDGALAEGEARALFYRVRARMQAAGYALSSFIVNGKETSPAAAGDAVV